MPAPNSLNGRSQLLCIFGWPLSYTRSPAFQNAALRAAGLNAAYVALPVPDEAAFLSLLAGLQASPQFLGGNVTNPYKVAALKRVHVLSPAARAIGAVNCVRRGRRGWEGHNTDAGGFLAALRRGRIPIQGRRVLLLGAGGAARAVAWACGQARVAELVVLARRPAQAKACASLAGRRGRSAVLDARTVAALSAGTDLVINSLPGESLGRRFGAALAPGKGWALDISYTPAETAFCIQARRQGWRASNGLSLLLEQGVLAFEWWFKKAAPRSQMAAALRKV